MTMQQLEEKCRDIRKDVICMIFGVLLCLKQFLGNDKCSADNVSARIISLLFCIMALLLQLLEYLETAEVV